MTYCRPCSIALSCLNQTARGLVSIEWASAFGRRKLDFGRGFHFFVKKETRVLSPIFATHFDAQLYKNVCIPLTLRTYNIPSFRFTQWPLTDCLTDLLLAAFGPFVHSASQLDVYQNDKPEEGNWYAVEYNNDLIVLCVRSVSSVNQRISVSSFFHTGRKKGKSAMLLTPTNLTSTLQQSVLQTWLWH